MSQKPQNAARRIFKRMAVSGHKERSCLTKLQINSEGWAIVVRDRMVARHPGEKFTYYHCPHCHLWHIGHTKEAKDAR